VHKDTPKHTLHMSEKIEIQQGEIRQDIKPQDYLILKIRCGACIAAIARMKNGNYAVGHIPPGEVIREVESLFNAHGNVALYYQQFTG